MGPLNRVSDTRRSILSVAEQSPVLPSEHAPQLAFCRFELPFRLEPSNVSIDIAERNGDGSRPHCGGNRPRNRE